MKVRSILLINSVLGFVFGIGFIVLPDFICKLLNFAVVGDGPLAMRFGGIMIFGVSVIAFGARSMEDIKSLKKVTVYLAVIYSMMFIYHVILQLFFQVGNTMLWAVDVLHFAFAVYYWVFTARVQELDYSVAQLQDA